MELIKWLYPGMRIKRWLVLSLVGQLLVVSGVFLFSRFPAGTGGRVGGVAMLAAGLLMLVGGLFLACRSLMGVLVPGGGCVVNLVYARRYLKRGPKVVALGGGTGLPVLLRGLKNYTSNLTAVVTVSDDGGSSGRLRGEMGILPPGDIRNCLVALADREPLMEELLQYRFKVGEMAGHSMGNLLLAALNDIAGGFDRAVKNLSRVLAVRGQVLPVTLRDVCLCAETEDGVVICGESKISTAGRKIKRVFLQPGNCYTTDEVRAAIEEADAIVLGPGSLYTSVLPNLLVKGVVDAIARSSAVKIYVCNIMTQVGETRGYTAADHVRAILEHAGPVIDYVVVNTGEISQRVLARYRREGADQVRVDLEELEKLGVKPVPGKLVQEGNVVRHHPELLADLLMRLIAGARGKGSSSLRSGFSSPSAGMERKVAL